MTFLLGAFGKAVKLLNRDQIASVALSERGQGDISSLITENAYILAGHRRGKSTADRIALFSANGGMLTGTFFQGKSSDLAQFTPEIERAIISDPKTLIKEYWGRYVGALLNKSNQTVTLIRDPIGLHTLFYATISGGILFSTELSLLHDILGSKPALDWNYFAEYIINSNQTLPSTPFLGIKELLPGMGLCVTLDGRVSQNYLWDLNSVKGSTIKDNAAFEEELLVSLKTCTKAWAEQSRGICLQLSGGLDSSGIMILLREVLSQEKKIIGINYFDSSSNSSDETKYAQEVADACDVPLFLVDIKNDRIFDSLPQNWRPSRPSNALASYLPSQQLAEFVSQHGCDVVMNGQGGDHVFIAPPPRNILADLWLDKKFGSFFSTMQELSGIYRMPWSELIKINIKELLGYYRGASPIESLDIPYLNLAFVQNMSRHDFYLKEELRKFYPAKAAQIKGLFHAVAYAERNHHNFFHDYSHPLLSQPLVELALKIPTFDSFKTGFDRIFFRRAISRIKSPEALWRRIKGHTSGSSLKIIASKADEILSILLEGSLSKSGIMNQEWVKSTLIKIKHGHCDNLWPLLHMVNCQLWLNQWGR